MLVIKGSLPDWHFDDNACPAEYHLWSRLGNGRIEGGGGNQGRESVNDTREGRCAEEGRRRGRREDGSTTWI